MIKSGNERTMKMKRAAGKTWTMTKMRMTIPRRKRMNIRMQSSPTKSCRLKLQMLKIRMINQIWLA